MKTAVVIPSRPGREKFIAKCLGYMGRQTMKPDHIIIVDYPAKDESIDLVPRYKYGFLKAFDLYKCDLAICIENDDWYSDNYIQFMVEQWEKNLCPDVIGINHSIYYNISHNKYTVLSHPGRASMMNMAVTANILDINWCPEDYAYLDFHIWTRAKKLKKISVPDCDRISIGIKHGIGLCGGGGHIVGWKHYTHEDKDWQYFSNIVKNESDINFYKNISDV